MDLKDIKELMNAMRRTGTKRVAIKRREFELELERDTHDASALIEAQGAALERSRENMVFSHGGMMPVYHPSGPAEPPKPEAVPTKVVEETGNIVKSPMVGTFYTSPSPDDPPFAKIGEKVEKDTVLCIIEAMKVMNEVKAGVSGTLEEVLVETGHPVEFGTKLFRIK